MSTDGNAIVREGISAGLIGASAIAIWFGILDAFSGTLLATPIMLGASLATLFQGIGVPSNPAAFLLYTVFHYALFIGIGLLLAWVAGKAEKAPSALIGFLGLFVAFQVGWVGWTTVLAQSFGELAWYQVFLANVIASASMGYYMYRQHPALPGKVNRLLVTTD